MDRIAILSGFIEKNPADLFSCHALALEYIKAGDEKKAIALFEDILRKDATYVGSYYHLGKAYERKGDSPKALGVYQLGMDVALKINDQHARRELMAAFNQLQDEMEDENE